MGSSINWKSYNRNLINRGQITFWVEPQILESWIAQPENKRGGQLFYSDLAIETLSLIRFRFGLTLRSSQGFAESLMELMKIELPVPNYSTVSRRLGKLSVKLKATASSKENLHVVLDSTGLKVYGEGEWKVRQHGYSKRRTWLKLHLAVDAGNNQILSVALTSNDFKDSELFEELIDEIPAKISQASADGAYDTQACFKLAEKKKFFPSIPPRRGAKIGKHGNNGGRQDLRDKNIRGIRKWGRKGWKKKVGYHQRSLSETAMYRYKTIFGGKMNSREFNRQANEAFFKCQILNKMKTPKFA